MRTKKDVILIICEGDIDQDLMTSITKNNTSKTTYKIMNTDFLTSDIYQVDESNFDKKLTDLVSGRIKEIMKKDYLKTKDFTHIYYLTDSDNCFYEETKPRLKKRMLLKKMLTKSTITINKMDINFNVLYYSINMEHCFLGEIASDEEEKLKLQKQIRELIKSDKILLLIHSEDIKNFTSYESSYEYLRVENGRATNIDLIVK